MANIQSSNTIFVDSTGDLTTDKNVLVSYITVTATAANAILLLADTVSPYNNKLELRVATSGTSENFEYFARPLVFPNGIRVVTCTNAKATIVATKVAGGSN